MPRSRPDSERLQTAAAHLEEAAGLLGESGQLPEKGQEEYLESAALVRRVASPGGWKRLQAEGGPRGATEKMALTIDRSLKAALEAAAQEFETPLSRVVTEGFRAVVDGKWTPPRVPRAVKPDLTVLNVRVDKEMFDRVKELAPELQQELGYRVTRSGIAVSYLAWDLGVEQPGAGLDILRLILPKALVAHLEARAAAEGVSLQEVAEDGIRALLDGAWTPAARPRTAAGTWLPSDGGPVEKGSLTIRVNGELLAGLRERAAELSRDADHPFHPGSIVRSILTDRFGEPAE